MRNLAEKSGGIFLMANQSTQFLPKLTNAGGLKPTYIERETEIEPHTIWWLLMVILTLLSLEWFFRKRNAML
jgi:dipeptidase